jgi:predicted MFS family arabinose efflux permease
VTGPTAVPSAPSWRVRPLTAGRITTDYGVAVRVVDAVAPARLGVAFRWLLASTWVSNIADGVSLAAGPLLVAHLTRSTALVALAATLQWLPPLLFGLVAGVVTDRLDRRRIVVAVDVVRCGALAVLIAAIATGEVDVWLVLVALFVFATADTFGTNASQTMLPLLVHRDDLTIGNARLQTGFVTLNQLAGPPIGAALFSAGRVWPFATEVVLVAAAAALVVRVPLPRQPRSERRPVGHEVLEGVRWAVRNAAVRTLVLTIFTFNITYGAAWSVLVVYARERLGFGSIGFGLITTVEAVGGVIATVGYVRLTRHVSLGNLMRAGLIIETLTHLALALTTSQWFALLVFAVFGAHAFAWGTTSITVRQRAVPAELHGRINSVNSVGTYGGLVIGSGIGGVIAERWGVTAPFWFAFAGSAAFVVLIWRQLAHVAHEGPVTARAG